MAEVIKTTHIVKSGETLSVIGAKYGTTAQKIFNKNQDVIYANYSANLKGRYPTGPNINIIMVGTLLNIYKEESAELKVISEDIQKKVAGSEQDPLKVFEFFEEELSYIDDDGDEVTWDAATNLATEELNSYYDTINEDGPNNVKNYVSVEVKIYARSKIISLRKQREGLIEEEASSKDLLAVNIGTKRNAPEGSFSIRLEGVVGQFNSKKELWERLDENYNSSKISLFNSQFDADKGVQFDSYPNLGFYYHKAIRRNDLVLINFNKPINELSDVNDMIGLVDRVGLSKSVSDDGTPRIDVIITGRNLGKVLVDDKIYFTKSQVQVLGFDNQSSSGEVKNIIDLIQNTKDRTVLSGDQLSGRFLGNKDITPLDWYNKSVKILLNRFLNETNLQLQYVVDNENVGVFKIGENNDLSSLVKFNIDKFLENRIIVSGVSLMTARGTLWNIFMQIANPDFVDSFVDTYHGKFFVTFREPRVEPHYITSLPRFKLDSRVVIKESLSVDDGNLFTWFQNNATSIVIEGEKKQFLNPVIAILPLISKFGSRPYISNNPYFQRATTVAREFLGTSLPILRYDTFRLMRRKILGGLLEKGSIEFEGNVPFKIGYPLEYNGKLYMIDGIDKGYSVEGKKITGTLHLSYGFYTQYYYLLNTLFEYVVETDGIKMDNDLLFAIIDNDISFFENQHSVLAVQESKILAEPKGKYYGLQFRI